MNAQCGRSTIYWLLANGRARFPPDELQRARATIVVRELQPGNYACHKGDLANDWVGVIDGLVKAESLSDNGKSVTFATLPANSWFGEGSILKQEARKYDVIALRQSYVALMPDLTFFWLLDTSISFNRFILNQLNERLGQFMGAFEHAPSTGQKRGWPIPSRTCCIRNSIRAAKAASKSPTKSLPISLVHRGKRSIMLCRCWRNLG